MKKIKQKLLANIFTDGVILQRDMPIQIWGAAEPNSSIRINFDQNTYQTTANSNGTWQATLPSLPSTSSSTKTPHKLTVSSGDITQEVNDIIMGDIWICSGQSNMELPMTRTRRMLGVYNKTANNPHIRQYHVPMNYNFHEKQTDIPESSWIFVKPTQTENFSATAFFFANKLYEEQKIPIGLILSALGGTPVESWMSREALSDYPEALAQADACKQKDFMENITTSEQRAHNEWYQNLNKYDRGLNEQWHKEDFPDEDWKQINLDQPWDEVTDLKASGVIWFRKKIEIPPKLAHQSADIILGCIADADAVYINGTQIGATDYRYPPRDYPIPNLKPGINTIAIRIMATIGMGEFIFGKAHKLLFADKTEIPLTKGWKYKRSLSCPPLAGMTFFQNRPTGNYNGMIAPLHNFPIKGVIWYQGESNAVNPEGYSEKFSTLIKDWRKNWNQGDFPFIFAQLSNWSPKGALQHWELLRDQQTKTLEIPRTRMVVTNDVGEYNDLHPLNKKAVGERLAGEVLSLAYGSKIVSTGPTLTSIKKTGNQFSIDFETFGSDLTLKHGNVVYGFSIWINETEIPIEGTIIATKVIVETQFADKVTAISYAWIDDPADANLYNAEGLPTVPFKKEV